MLLELTLRVSEPCSRTYFMLKIRIFVHDEMAMDFQTGQSMAKACRAFLILAVISSSAPPVYLLYFKLTVANDI